MVMPSDGAIYVSPVERVAPYVAEFLGTFLLTMTFLCNYALTSDPVWATTSNAFMVTALMYALSHVSGPNLNPSVSIALCLAGRHTPRVAALFCLSQVLGAAAAAVLRYQISNVSVEIGPMSGVGWFEVAVVEVLYTAMICFVYLNCASSAKNNPVNNRNGFSGLAFGLCFIASGYAAREISNTVMNSAVAIGLGIVDSHGGFSKKAFGYLLYDTIGALLGAGAYRVVRPREFRALGPLDLPEERETESAQVSAEFIGTFFVVLTKALNRMSGTRDEGPEAWSVAAALTSMAYALRGVSGGHFNPAVTLSAAMSGRNFCSRRLAMFYIVAQIVAGLTASSTFAIVNHGVDIQITFSNTQHSKGAAPYAEMLFTGLLCYVVLSTSLTAPSSAASQQNNMAGFAYGACQTVGGFAIGNISGSLLNPAVVVAFSGLRLLDKDWKSTAFPYIAYQAAGAILATGIFLVTHAHTQSAGKGKLSLSP